MTARMKLDRRLRWFRSATYFGFGLFLIGILLGAILVVASLILVVGLRTFWTPSKPSLVDGQSRADDDDAKKLEGTWEVLSFEARGEKKQPDEIQAMTVTFRGDQMVFSDGGIIKESGHFKLDPSKKPKSLDCTHLVIRMGKKINETAQCIYELDGDTLKFCCRWPGGNRPTEFTGKDTDGFMTLKKRRRIDRAGGVAFTPNKSLHQPGHANELRDGVRASGPREPADELGR